MGIRAFAHGIFRGSEQGANATTALFVLGTIATLFACSSSSTPNPPMLPGCTSKDGVPCGGALAGGGGSSAQGDGGSSDDGASGSVGDGGDCPGAAQIFGTSTAACMGCVAANCCVNPTSCPNDRSCSSVAICALNCLPGDPTCVQGCEAQASLATVTAFTDLAACSMSNCTQCPTLETASGDI